MCGGIEFFPNGRTTVTNFFFRLIIMRFQDESSLKVFFTFSAERDGKMMNF